MKRQVEFEWLAGGEEEGEWETIAQTEKRRWLSLFGRVSKRVWITLAAIVFALSTTSYFVVRYTFLEAQRKITFQIQNVIDLEARAFAQGDKTRFLAQQDSAAFGWYTRQVTRINPNCTEFETRGAPYPWQPLDNDPLNRCAPVLPAEIVDVNLQRDVAWVEVIEGEPPVRRMRFYRQTARGWVHTAPDETFWQAPIRVRYGSVFVRYHKRDQPYIAPLEARIGQVVGDVCAVVMHCAAINKIEIDFSTQTPATMLSDPQEALERDGTLVLSSPWLSGIPVDGVYGESMLDSLTYWVAYGMIAKASTSLLAQDMNQLQRSIADEYAAWYGNQDITQAPLLRRIVDRHGMEELPRMFFSLKGTRLYSLFLIQWLGLSTRIGETAFFESLLNIEREAILTGRKETFLLFQDDGWIEERAHLFDELQLTQPVLDPVRVKAVERIDGCARVILDEVSMARQSRSEQTVAVASVQEQDPFHNPIEFFCMQDWNWTHTRPFD
ncbi:MAG: hypothetical protein JXA89_28025 [Anaerolineae bacterium]|nr:hypothetical protein [Anaerolineae bacterium]